ncbi:type I phosphomannose isomerase catalytic subunit [Rubritalea tangerina]|uniref:Type I phosphomannose isomerase catalytic subunit n=1 Tax=Rubritalea tangerina TaxID=430798 RepID=A0ABW4ZDU5_9BACT
MPVLSFQPIYQTRVWGGRKLESIYQRPLPTSDPYGESWEISDRPEAQSIVTSGPYQGESLHSLWQNQRAKLFGPYQSERFPLLIKILDAQTDLSIQVHPPQHLAASLNGEPKTEMWYIAHAEPDAKIYVGLKQGTTKEAFEQALKQSSPEELVHAISPKTGQSIHIPSGRLHAIGAGLVIYEIQQNSDTTYRVFDWNRLGLDGKPRELHIEESLQCIDFQDFEPTMDTPQGNTLAVCPYYKVDSFSLTTAETIANPDSDRFSILTVVSGSICDQEGTSYGPGSFLLVPAGDSPLTAETESLVLQTTLPVE